jgi:acyl transferase domain-containing protein/3-hydroxymyristoyl/3-hydroxydecanoyl-(acyl carrier protein) dehydratase
MTPRRAIAIVGLGGRFPGAASASALWNLVVDGRSMARAVPVSRWPVEASAVVSAAGGVDRARSQTACVLDPFEPDLRGLDVEPATLTALSKLTLDVAVQTFRSAAEAKIDRTRTSAIIANIALPTDGASRLAEQLVLGPIFGEHAGAVAALEAFPSSHPIGVMAKALGLGKGSYTLDAACASSLYALHLGCVELEAKRVDAVLAGGVSLPQQLYTQIGFTQLHALSPSGVCAPFTTNADGLVVGEGGGMVLLKRLEDAERDGDRVLAVIRGIGLSNDVGGSLLSPDSEGQLRAMRSAYAMAGWSPSEVQLVECHGTGTPRGDQVELNSLKALFGGASPVIGSVKSNVGHLLTAAGMAGLTKVLGAISNRTLPPNANATSVLGSVGPLTFLEHASPWTSSAPRRAAVSGFGFGGINAHVLIEEYAAGPRIDVTQSDAEPIAIVGLGVHVGSLDSLERFSTTLFSGGTALSNRPETRWKSPSLRALQGGWIEALEIPMGRFKVPPLELSSVLPQQLLMLEVAANAVEDAGGLGPGPHPRVGAVVGISLDLESTSFHLRWVLERHARKAVRDAGLEVTESELGAWLKNVGDALSAPLDPQRVLGALGGIVTSRLARELSLGGPSFAVQAEEGSGLRALEVASRLLQRFEVDRMIVGAVELGGDVRRVLAAEALKRVGLPSDGAAAVVLKRLSDATRDNDSIAAILRGFGAAPERDVKKAVEAAWHEAGAPAPDVMRQPSELDDQLGVPGAAAGLVSVVESVLSLRHRVRGKGKGARAAIWSAGPSPRRVGVTSHGFDGTALHVALEQAGSFTPSSAFEGSRPAGIFLVDASSRDALVELATSHRHESIDRLAATWFQRSSHSTSAVTATSVDDLLRQLETSLEPFRVDGELAFVFPGSGSHFDGMGETLPLSFPEALERLGTEVHDFSRHVFPQIAEGPGGLAEIIVRQVTHGLVVHDALRLLGVSPQAYMGYSLGESAGLFASRAWRDRDTMFQRTLESPLFRSQLTKSGSVLRDAWGEDAEWAVALVMRSKEEIRSALSGTATLLIVNAPGECVIGGRKDDVRAVIGRLGGAAVFLEGVPFVHLPAIAPVQEDYRALHLLPTTPVPGVRFYSAAWARTYEVTTENCAASIVANAMHGFDFTALIEQAYADGVRVFVEPGPQGSCTRMIGRILRNRPHLAVAACQRGNDGYVSLLNAVAKLANAGFSIELSPLYANSRPLKVAPKAKGTRVVVGGGAIDVPPLPGRSPREHVDDSRVMVMKPALISSPEGRVAVQSIPVVISAPSSVLADFLKTATSTARAHETFLQVAEHSLALQTRMLAELTGSARSSDALLGAEPLTPSRFDRAACLEFATGKLSKVLGSDFLAVDAYPTRVRLPAEPLMLVDRIVEVEGEIGSLTKGRVVTEHDVRPGAWYLDGGRVPVCISVEAGQADLFLSAYLGIDLQTKGERVYRLLDAKIVFHRDLPRVGEVIRYDIRIDRFVRQGDTWLFFFRFDGTIGGEPFITMFDGCAGFFSAEQLNQGKGIVSESTTVKTSAKTFVPPAPHGTATLSEIQVEALRRGDVRSAFGLDFPVKTLASSLWLPSGRMKLVDRILQLDTQGGEARLGLVLGEHDVTPDAWYLTCHFSDDPVMPGTLMYECCLHTLRVLLLRIGWVDDANDVDLHYAPILGQPSQLKCRGQVLSSTKKVQYRVEVDEIGYGPEPYVVATASMFADGKHVVQMRGMSVRIKGLTQERLDTLWNSVPPSVFSREQIIEYCEGSPSKCFGPAYLPFDSGQRRLARLPRDPFRFIDRVTACEPQPLVMEPGGWLTCEYDVPTDAWYFGANRQKAMPFSVLLEAALQPCGFLAAYVGSALTTNEVLSFRNLDGSAKVSREVFADVGTLVMRSRLTKVSRAGGMLLQEFDFEVSDRVGLVYRGHTGFGFFPPAALEQQVGVRGGTPWELKSASQFELPIEPPMQGLVLPGKAYAMIEAVDALEVEGGLYGFGFVGGHKRVDPSEWFFKAHFFQDPVMPGSLGLEALQQLLLVYSRKRMSDLRKTHRLESMAVGQQHAWQYRGQVVPTNSMVQVQAQIKQVIDGRSPLIVADGQLICDGKVIYSMKDFAVRLVPELV